MLAAHCRATLRPASGGGYRLCCPPEVERFIFRSHWLADTWTRLSAIDAAVDLVGGDPSVPDNDWVSSALPEMAAAMQRARLAQIAGPGHPIIAERPQRCAALVFEGLGL